jgi:hypothetical protein
VFTQRLKVLLAVVAAMVLLVGAGAAYAANSTQNTGTGAGDNNGAQVAGNDDSDGPGDDADEPGDHDGPGDTED